MPSGTFWTQFLISSIGGGGLSAAVGVVVSVLFRRWIRQTFGEPGEITSLAQTAANQSKHAAGASRRAEVQAKSAATAAGGASASADGARENSRQASEALVFVGDQLGDVVAENRGMARRVDDLLAANLQLRTLLRQRGIAVPDRLAPSPDESSADDALVTGRHRLFTRGIPTIDEGDHP